MFVHKNLYNTLWRILCCGCCDSIITIRLKELQHNNIIEHYDIYGVSIIRVHKLRDSLHFEVEFIWNHRNRTKTGVYLNQRRLIIFIIWTTVRMSTTVKRIKRYRPDVHACTWTCTGEIGRNDFRRNCTQNPYSPPPHPIAPSTTLYKSIYPILLSGMIKLYTTSIRFQPTIDHLQPVGSTRHNTYVAYGVRYTVVAINRLLNYIILCVCV